jgi:hypothetical protein
MQPAGVAVAAVRVVLALALLPVVVGCLVARSAALAGV